MAKSKPVPTQGYSIDEFCTAFGFSRPFFYKLKKRGIAPRIMNLGGRQIISNEATADWKREREQHVAA